MEIQQSPQYLKYVQTLGWKTCEIDGVAVITKHFPILGGLAKIQRPAKLPSLNQLIPFLKSEKISIVAPEPDSTVKEDKFQPWCEQLGKSFKINKSSYLPTKTIIIDLTSTEDEIFKRFTEAKQRAVRRAAKNGVIIRESNNIGDLIKIKNKSAGWLGFITTYGIRKLWPIMAPEHATILLAYSTNNASLLSFPRRRESIAGIELLNKNWIPDRVGDDKRRKLIGGILLLFMDKIAYYWIAGATHEGKKLFAPTLLVWEALKISKKRGCRIFDFVGVWDERNPEYFKAWHGFTKFKEGFGGHPVYYPIATPHKLT